MPPEPMNRALDELVEETARQIIFTLAPGATSDPLTAIKQLLYDYLDQAQEQLAQDTIRQQSDEERAQQN